MLQSTGIMVTAEEVEKMIDWPTPPQYLAQMDRIVVTPAEVESMIQWRDQHREYIYHYKEILKEGIVEVSEASYTAFRFLEGGRTQFKLYVQNALVAYLETLRVEGDKYKVVRSGVGSAYIKLVTKAFGDEGVTTDEEETRDLLMQDIVTVVLTCMAYMEHCNDDVKVVEEHVKKGSSTHGKKKAKDKRRANIIKLRKTIKFVRIRDDAGDEIQDGPVDHHAYERRTELWGVKGHYRHYKSGKTTWIRPHNAGPGKKKSPKTYVIGDETYDKLKNEVNAQ